MRKAYLMASSSLLAAVLATSAHAQVGDAQAGATQVAQAEQGNTIAEVVVTAEKREQSLQDVPTAVTAFTAERRDLIGIVNIQDMTNFTPGLQYSSQTDRTSLRGVGRLTNVRTAEGGVAIYSDGVYTTSTVEAGKSPLFVDRVEVLRGPQGTLYGRNSISGAINVISKRPTDEFYAEVRGQVGNYNRTLYEAAVSGPLFEGMQFRLAANREQQREGWYDNVVPGLPDEGNIIDTSIIEAQLQFQLGERFEGWVKASTINWNNGGGGPGARNNWTPAPYETYQYANLGLTLNPGYGCRTSPTPIQTLSNVVNASPLGCVNPALTDERAFASVVPYDVDLNDTFILAGDFTYSFDNFDVRYITGGVRYHYELAGPQFYPSTSPPITQYTLPTVAGTPGLTIFPTYGFTYQELISWHSHELNFASTHEGPLQWLAGLYYFSENDRQPVTTELFFQPQASGPYSPFLGGVYCAQTGGVCAPQQGRTIYDNRPESYIKSRAVYGQIDYEFATDFKLTAGLRYTDDEKGGVEEVRVNCFAVPTCFAAPELAVLGPLGVPLVDVTQFPTVTSQPPATAPLPPGVTSRTTFDPATGLAKRSFQAGWTATTGTLGLQWEPDADTNAYFRYSRGFKAGGFRVGIDTTLGGSPLTDAEYADNYEVGLKRNFFNDQLQANVAIFRLNYENAQIPLNIISTSGGLATSQAVFYNIPEAISQGLELELTWQPIDNLQILFNYSYLDTEITNATGVIDPADPAALSPQATPQVTQAQCLATPGLCAADVFTVGQPNGGFQRGQNLAGNRLPNAPENKIALNANYTVETTAGDIILSGTYTWRDEQYGSMFTRDYWKSPAFDQVDARVTFRSSDDKYSVILYGRNLTDDIGYEGGAGAVRRAGFSPTLTPIATAPFVAVVPTPEVQGIASVYPLTPPRTFGIELQYRFF